MQNRRNNINKEMPYGGVRRRRASAVKKKNEKITASSSFLAVVATITALTIHHHDSTVGTKTVSGFVLPTSSIDCNNISRRRSSRYWCQNGSTTELNMVFALPPPLSIMSAFRNVVGMKPIPSFKDAKEIENLSTKSFTTTKEQKLDIQESISALKIVTRTPNIISQENLYNNNNAQQSTSKYGYTSGMEHIYPTYPLTIRDMNPQTISELDTIASSPPPLISISTRLSSSSGSRSLPSTNPNSNNFYFPPTPPKSPPPPETRFGGNEASYGGSSASSTTSFAQPAFSSSLIGQPMAAAAMSSASTSGGSPPFQASSLLPASFNDDDDDDEVDSNTENIGNFITADLPVPAQAMDSSLSTPTSSISSSLDGTTTTVEITDDIMNAISESMASPSSTRSSTSLPTNAPSASSSSSLITTSFQPNTRTTGIENYPRAGSFSPAGTNIPNFQSQYSNGFSDPSYTNNQFGGTSNNNAKKLKPKKNPLANFMSAITGSNRKNPRQPDPRLAGMAATATGRDPPMGSMMNNNNSNNGSGNNYFESGYSNNRFGNSGFNSNTANQISSSFPSNTNGFGGNNANSFTGNLNGGYDQQGNTMANMNNNNWSSSSPPPPPSSLNRGNTFRQPQRSQASWSNQSPGQRMRYNPSDPLSYYGNVQRGPLDMIDNKRLSNPSTYSSLTPKTDVSRGQVVSSSPTMRIEGDSQRTIGFASKSVDRVQLSLFGPNNRPLNARIELWSGPENVPQRISCYSEDGTNYPVSIALTTPGTGNALSIRNTSPLEFPMTANVQGEVGNGQTSNRYDSAQGIGWVTDMLIQTTMPQVIQGNGCVKSFPFPKNVGSVQVLLRTDGYPMNSIIELISGPNNNKQIIEIYSEDGYARPFYAVIETPGGFDNVVRVVNTSPLEFPLTANVAVHSNKANGPFGKLFG